MDTLTVETIGLGSAGIIGISSNYVTPWLWRQRRMALVRKKVLAQRSLALTYDDGPDGTATPRLLDILKSSSARATFFMLGQNAHNHPEVANRVLREGHEIGCHSDQHLDAWRVSPWQAARDVQQGYLRLSPWIQPNAAFRPPYGRLTVPTYRLVHRQGARIWWWTIDSGDSHKELPSLRQATEKLRRERGGIVLMHDGSLTSRSQERHEYTLAVTMALLEIAKQEGINTIALRELAE